MPVIASASPWVIFQRNWNSVSLPLRRSIIFCESLVLESSCSCSRQAVDRTQTPWCFWQSVHGFFGWACSIAHFLHCARLTASFNAMRACRLVLSDLLASASSFSWLWFPRRVRSLPQRCVRSASSACRRAIIFLLPPFAPAQSHCAASRSPLVQCAQQMSCCRRVGPAPESVLCRADFVRVGVQYGWQGPVKQQALQAAGAAFATGAAGLGTGAAVWLRCLPVQRVAAAAICERRFQLLARAVRPQRLRAAAGVDPAY